MSNLPDARRFGFPYSEEELKEISSGALPYGTLPSAFYRSDLPAAPLSRDPATRPVDGADKPSLDKIWDKVFEPISEIVKEAVPDDCVYINAPPWNTHGPGGSGLEFRAVWIIVEPDSTSTDTAHNASQKILNFLHEKGVDDTIVEWGEGFIEEL